MPTEEQKTMDKSTLTFAKIWYGDNTVKIESDGACAVEFTYKGEPYMSTYDNYKIGENRILMWKDYDETFPDGTLFTYGNSLKIVRAKAIDWNLNEVMATLIVENVSLWPLMEGEWEFSGKWENLKRDFGGTGIGIAGSDISGY